MFGDDDPPTTIGRSNRLQKGRIDLHSRDLMKETGAGDTTIHRTDPAPAAVRRRCHPTLSTCARKTRSHTHARSWFRRSPIR